jgi:hypothetical protein
VLEVVVGGDPISTMGDPPGTFPSSSTIHVAPSAAMSRVFWFATTTSGTPPTIAAIFAATASGVS